MVEIHFLELVLSPMLKNMNEVQLVQQCVQPCLYSLQKFTVSKHHCKRGWKTLKRKNVLCDF